jgi:hypothetical protein
MADADALWPRGTSCPGSIAVTPRILELDVEQTHRRSVLIQPCRLDGRFQRLVHPLLERIARFSMRDVCQWVIAFFAICRVFFQ